MSLRDAKREETGRALAQAAFDLACERGLDGFTIDDLVHRAGYSRRTFANHFSGKEQAVVAVASEQVRHALDPAPDDDLPLIDWLHQVAKAQLNAGLFIRLRELRRLAQTYPSLRPHMGALQREITETARGAVLARIERSNSTTNWVYAHLLVGAAYGALSCVLDGHVEIRPPDVATAAPDDGESAIGLDEFLHQTFGYLRTGF